MILLLLLISFLACVTLVFLVIQEIGIQTTRWSRLLGLQKILFTNNIELNNIELHNIEQKLVLS